MTKSPKTSPKMLALVTGALAAGAALVVGAIYGIGGFERNATAEAGCAQSTAAASRITPLARGHVASLIPAGAPLSVADLTFTGPDGQPMRLGDFRGRTVLLNLWATWCVPCRLEMPALDRLQGQLGSKDFQVVAVNLDTKDPDKPTRFLQDTKIEKLGWYADPTIGLFKTLQQRGRSRGMPTTMLVGPDGCEIGTMNGPAEWDHADAVRLITAAMTP
jgi:thiol-disulfide isomerase/thioredoxin